ncbi:MAG: LysM peptidoglycan-binding domain-containing protein [Holophagaceae bacterium]|nr:LysM peptidoglycan-binding domain-containing protein [Holophagaceae bacterium]
MAQKRWLGVLGLFSVLPCLAITMGDQDPRVSETVVIQRHSSRWDYPKEVTVLPGQILHIVAKGDTLWDLGRKYLGSPYAWPQIWERNKWIADPHWIYPGDPLIVQTGAVVITEDDEPDSEISDLPPGGGQKADAISVGWVRYAYSFQDYLQLPYLATNGADAYFRQVGAQKVTGVQKEQRHNLSRGDVVYVDGGLSKGHQPGDRMMVHKVVKNRLMHPDDRFGLQPIGDVIQHAAILRIISVHSKNSEAVVEDTQDGVEVGDFVTPFLEPALILKEDVYQIEDVLEPISTKTTAKIVYGRNGASFLSNGSLVIIDRGTKGGYNVGDVLVCLRPNSLINQDNNGPQTNRYLGQLLVVRADADSSTCLIIITKSEMTLGDVVTN